MTKFKYLLLIFGILLLTTLSFKFLKEDPVDRTVTFPKISEPIQITKNGKEHFYASYFGINSFSKSERYATVLETNLKYVLPKASQPATLGLVDLETKTFKPLTKTHAWNFQQGCMAHWLGTSPDSLIIYNDIRDGKTISVIMNVHTQEELRLLPFPVSTVSPDGKTAVSINFSRIRKGRPGYGYGGDGQKVNPEVPFPEDDGIFAIDLETGKSKLIVSYADLKDRVPDVPKGGIEYIGHTLLSPDGKKIFFLARAIPKRNTVAFIVNIDGTNLQKCFPQGWDGSHFDWRNNNQMVVTAAYKAKQYSHVFFTVGKQDYVRLGNGALDFDGHSTFSPNGKWMTTDTYPKGAFREQKIYLLNMKTQALLCIGNFSEPEEYSKVGTYESVNGIEEQGKFWRCDLHCRWSRSGNIIGFNSTKSGSRQAYIMRVKY